MVLYILLIFVIVVKVVNDVAERGVALIQKFNATITQSEEQKQFLLQVVEKHRKLYQNCNKINLISNQKFD